MIGIYKITSPTKRVYIGQSVDIKKRLLHYKRLECEKQSKLYNSLKKYGVEKHKFEIIHICNIEELNEKERYYQDLYQVINKSGLNLKLTETNDRRCEFSEELRLSMSKRFKGIKRSPEAIEKTASFHSGRKRSEETRKKMSEAKMGKPISQLAKEKQQTRKKVGSPSEETKQKMRESKTGKIYERRIVLNTETGVFYNGAKDAAKVFNKNYKSLMNSLSGKYANKTSFIYA